MLAEFVIRLYLDLDKNPRLRAPHSMPEVPLAETRIGLSRVARRPVGRICLRPSFAGILLPLLLGVAAGTSARVR